MILYALIYFLNGISLAFFITAGMRMFFYARRTGSRPYLLFAICLGWMALIQVKEFFCNFIPFYNYEVLGPAFTFPDLFTLPLLSLFFFELVMPGRINLRYALRLLAPFALLGGTYLVGLLFFDRTIYLSLGEVIDDLPALLPATLLLYVVYAAGYCIFAFIRIVRFSLLYTEQIAQAYSFTERIHLRWMRWMAGILAFYLISYIGIIAFTTSENYIVFTFALSLAGFGSTTTFYRAFAKEKGETPQRWQEQHAQSKAQPAESTALPGAETQAEELPEKVGAAATVE